MGRSKLGPLLLLLLVAFAISTRCSAAAFVSIPQNIRAAARCAIVTASRRSVLASPSSSDTISSSKQRNRSINASVEQSSNELISLLLARRSGKATPADDARISSLVAALISAKVKFDPTKCLDGPLYVSNVIEGPAPLWERFGIKLGSGSSNNNLQGQQYRYVEGGEKSVINYAEIFGSAFHVKAYGTYEQDNTEKVDPSPVSSESTNGPLGGLLSLFGGSPTGQQSSSSSLIQCPADFTVTVTKGCFFILGNRLDVPISGTGYLRVLYADPNIRIFVSPKSTTDDRWEKAGLTVAQIRVDLVGEHAADDFEDLFQSD